MIERDKAGRKEKNLEGLEGIEGFREGFGKKDQEG